jgi:microcystin-dependent protein
VHAVVEPFLGEIRMFGGEFAPRGWATCDGQLLPIDQHAPLFSLIGTRYGGDGVATFALPDIPRSMPVAELPDGPEPAPRPVPRRRAQPITFIIALAGVFPGRP